MGLHRVLARPLFRSRIVLGPVRLVQFSNLRNQRIIRVRISQQRANRQQHLRDGESRGPLTLQNVQANATIAVNIAVVDLCLELHLPEPRTTSNQCKESNLAWPINPCSAITEILLARKPLTPPSLQMMASYP